MEVRLEDLKAQSAALRRYVDAPEPLITSSLILTSLLESSQHADLLIRCKEGNSIRAHRGVVCAQSKFFENACKPGHFKV